MNGWIGKILRVNLSSGGIAVQDIDTGLARQFLGSRGLAAKLLYDELDPDCDPLGPDNKLIFGTGPLTGTGATLSGRYTVSCKSPLTDGIGCANSGGYFGPEMKFAGFDLIVIEGRASVPAYLWVIDGRAELRNAEHIWGKTTYETEDAILAETDPNAKILEIGPAGEKQVLVAAIINDKSRAAGRGGVGAVMGSKNLKAIAVRGHGGVQVADKAAFLGALGAANEKLSAHPVTMPRTGPIHAKEPQGGGLAIYGTPVLVNIANECGILPTYNFQQGTFENADDISGETMVEQVIDRNKGCFGCQISCARITTIKRGRWAGESGEGPEYESGWALGANCGVSDLGEVTKANYLCNELGMDTISAGGTVACAMELYERGYISESETGRPLRFGDGEALVEMIEKMGRREGFGDVLAMGSYRMARKYGHPELFMGVRKQEFAAYDPRGAQGMGLGYATSNRGACHLKGYTIAPEILGIPEKIDPLVTEGKAFWQFAFQNVTAAFDSSGICLFTTFGMGADELAPQVSAAIGDEVSVDELVQIGERIWNVERLFNMRVDLGGSEDTLPDRILKDGLPGGAAKGETVRLGEMLPEYYELRGWNAQGEPTSEKLQDLGLAT
jgi:aldehyde:ferredoxin oxidoreductase